MIRPVPSHSIQSALDHLKAGGVLIIPTHTHTTVIKWKHIQAWRKTGRELLREDGDGYRMARGTSSVYLFPNQLCFLLD